MALVAEGIEKASRKKMEAAKKSSSFELIATSVDGNPGWKPDFYLKCHSE